MSLSHLYQEFSTRSFDPSVPMAAPPEGLEDVKLESFEDGYTAGWEDAVKAHGTDKDRAVVEISQRLEDINFTYEEAFVKLSSAMQPLLSKIALSLLPQVAQRALGPQIVDQVAALVDEGARNAIEIVVAPDQVTPLQDALEERISAHIAFASDPALSSGQVFLRVNTKEREINLDAVQNGIVMALDAFFDQTQKDQRNG